MTDGGMNAFYHFIQFSTFADKKERRRLSAGIYGCLTKKTARLPAHRGAESALWREALDFILFSAEGGASDPLVSMPLYGIETEVTCEILEFIEKTAAAYPEDASLAAERALIAECTALSVAAFAEYWDGLKAYIESCYTKHELDCAFYDDILARTIDTEKTCIKENIYIKKSEEEALNIKELFAEKWTALLEQKSRHAKRAYFKAEAAPFARQLRQKIDEFRRALSVFDVSSADTRKIYNASRASPVRLRADILEKADLFFKGDAALRRLAKELGRTRRGKREQKKPPLHLQAAGIEYCGFAPGGSLYDMPGAEAALMTDEDCALLFAVRFAEKRLLNYKKKPVYTRPYPDRRDERREGPFILCVDTSGSMQGAPELIAKSLCLALLKLSLGKKRLCYLISFAVDTMEIELNGLADNFDALCAFLSESFRGGTDITTALEKALGLLESAAYRDADVVVISDFIMPRLAPQTLDRVKRRKEIGVEFTGIFIGSRRAANPALTALFDRRLFYENRA